MADEKFMRDELIASIRKIRDELHALGGRREYINFRRLSDPELVEIEESISDQLRQKKKFLGEENL